MKITAVTYQIKGMRSSLDSAKQEQSEYKENATRMLQVSIHDPGLYVDLVFILQPEEDRGI